WPPYSPDINPIKHKVYELAPHIDNIINKDRQKEVLANVLPRAWKLISRDIIEEVISSMPRRVKALIAAQG
ncbi:uncharacterized protein MYCGRDRAFT_44748, partial [Zymoseptoria tritici IPO323]